MKFILKIFIFTAFVMQGYSQSNEDRWIDACGKLESGTYAESNSIFEELAKKNNTWKGRLWLNKGVSEYYLANWTEAEIDFKQAKRNSLIDANLWLARIAIVKQHEHEAINYLGDYLKKGANSDIELILRDSLFIALRQSEAWVLLEEEHSSTPVILANADVEFYISRRRFDDALNSINRISGQNEVETAELFAMRSQVYFAEMAVQLAINEINQALVLRPSNRNYLELKIDYLLEIDKADAAMILLNELLEEYPEDFSLRKRRIDIAMITSEFELASEDLEIILRYFSNSENLFLSGKIDYELGHYLNAMKTFNVLIEKEPPSADYFKARGMTYFQTRTLDQAAYDLSMSLDLRPDDAETNFFLALTERRRGNISLSCYYMTRALNYGEYRAVEYQDAYCK